MAGYGAPQEAQGGRLKGVCKNWSKGYGFITRDDGGGDVFVHQTQIQKQGFRSLMVGEAVEFEMEAKADGRMQAVRVTGPGGCDVKGGERPHNQGGGGGPNWSYGGGGGGYDQQQYGQQPYGGQGYGGAPAYGGYPAQAPPSYPPQQSGFGQPQAAYGGYGGQQAAPAAPYGGQAQQGYSQAYPSQQGAPGAGQK